MTHENPLILPFTTIRATDLPLVGGKGANLGELTHAGFPIPPGFCVTTIAFQQFIDASPDAADLFAQLDKVTANDVEMARQVGEDVRQALLTVPIPKNIVHAVGQQWQQVGIEDAYAVRSSATAEDLPDASFAGQQDTFLNIYGETALLDAIRRCWVSLFTDRAILYRTKNHFPHQDVKLSVVVQQMVMSEKSGILFTADPVTGHRYTTTVDASFGLGEALVSGIVSPDNYQVDTRNHTIIKRQIADKQIALYPEKDGGTRQEQLSAPQRTQTVLTDKQIMDLAQMGTEIEAHYGVPQDIEWAIVGDQHYLLQARPITSLFPIDNLQSPDDSLHIYFSAGHQQMMTNAMAPLSISSLRVVFPIGQEKDKIESNYIKPAGGRLFGDITLLLRNPISRKAILGLLSQFNELAPQTLQIAMQRSEFQRGPRPSISLSMLPKGLRMASRVFAALWWRDLTGVVAQVDNIITQLVIDVQTEIENLPAGRAKMETMIAKLQSQLFAVIQWAPYFVAGEMAKRLLARLGHGWANPDDVEAVNLGLVGNVVTEMNLAVGDLADVVRQSPQLVEFFNMLGNDSQAWLTQARQIEGSQPFFEAWDLFLAHFGSRGPSEIDIRALRWYEEPLPLLQVIAGYLQKDVGSHRTQHQTLVDARETAVARLSTQANFGLFGKIRQKMVRRLTYVIQYGGALREHHKFMMVQVMRIAKEELKKTAVVLRDKQQLNHSDDIWFLTWPDLLDIWDDEEQKFMNLTTKRRADFARFQKLNPPMVITSDGETPIVQYEVADAPPGALLGNPVSPGVIEGVVRVIHDPQSETLNPGEILVAPFTDPGWTPLFINAGGLIMEVGGNLTHGSVVAREYGIPAVVGVYHATSKLQTGQQIRIDGNRGMIEII